MQLSVDLTKSAGKIKPMNAVNNGPVVHYGDAEHISQDIENLVEYRAMRTPFARTHDTSIEYWYGGDHVVDISAVFPNEDADENDPASYDFEITDEYLKSIRDAGTEPFYRLGTKIEHWTKKYHIFPPKDNEKFARVCEHIIRHCNEGWAGGGHFGIRYWEIWNEPNLDLNWAGTFDEYITMYITVAKHLKKCFPDYMIGGPAFCGYPKDLVADFLSRVRDEKAPLDFCSWHEYAANTARFVDKIESFRADLDRFGFKDTLSICNEWNYILSFSGDKFRKSVDVINGMKGAAFATAVMCVAQAKPVDMMMYYDARPCLYCGLFDLYQLRPAKTYFPYQVFGDMLYDFGTSAPVAAPEPLYAVAATGKGDDFAVMISYYSENDDLGDKTFDLVLNGAEGKRVSVFVTDATKNMEKVTEAVVKDGKITLTMAENTVAVVRSDL